MILWDDSIVKSSCQCSSRNSNDGVQLQKLSNARPGLGASSPCFVRNNDFEDFDQLSQRTWAVPNWVALSIVKLRNMLQTRTRSLSPDSLLRLLADAWWIALALTHWSAQDWWVAPQSPLSLHYSRGRSTSGERILIHRTSTLICRSPVIFFRTADNICRCTDGHILHESNSITLIINFVFVVQKQFILSNIISGMAYQTSCWWSIKSDSPD